MRVPLGSSKAAGLVADTDPLHNPHQASPSPGVRGVLSDDAGQVASYDRSRLARPFSQGSLMSTFQAPVSTWG